VEIEASFLGYLEASRDQLGVDDDQAFQGHDITESLVGADEMVDGHRSMHPEGNGQLQRV